MVFPEGTNRDLVSVTLHCERPSIANIHGLGLHKDVEVVAVVLDKPSYRPTYGAYSRFHQCHLIAGLTRGTATLKHLKVIIGAIRNKERDRDSRNPNPVTRLQSRES